MKAQSNGTTHASSAMRRVRAVVAPLAAFAVLVPGAALVASGGSFAADASLAGDVEAGAKIYTRCEACHAFAYDRTGPRHCGLFGRRAGSVPGFDYSDAMKRSGLTWNAATLDRFLADPMRAVPGTTMGYAGVADARERADLIAYLRQQSRGPMCAK